MKKTKHPINYLMRVLHMQKNCARQEYPSPIICANRLYMVF